MKTINSLLLILITLHFFGCKSKQPKITGKILELNQGTVVLELLSVENFVPIDSCKISSYGEFEINHSVTEIGFYRLIFNKNTYINLIIDSAETINITGYKEKLPLNYKVTGSVYSQQLAELNQKTIKYLIQKDSIEQRYVMYRDTAGLKDNNDSIVNEIRKATFNVILEKEEYIKSFIETYPTSLACLAAINQLDKDDDFKYYFDTQNNLNLIYPNNLFVKDFSKRVDKMKFLAVGGLAPNISLSTPKGNTVSLSDLRGKFVLIDFWASWCAPCRKESPHLLELYNEYSKKEFEIYSVSLDAKKAAWEKAITEDGIGKWIHVSDLGYWQSSVVNQYKIEGIPFTVLVDPNGKIIAKGLHTTELKELLSEIL